MAEREGFIEAEKKTMLLSTETSAGLKITGMYIHTLNYYSMHMYNKF